MRVKFKKFSQRARVTTQAYITSAGFDLYSAETRLIPPCSYAAIENEVGVAIPRGYFGKIYARSSLAIRYTDVGGGVIYSGYRGQWYSKLGVFSLSFFKKLL